MILHCCKIKNIQYYDPYSGYVVRNQSVLVILSPEYTPGSIFILTEMILRIITRKQPKNVSFALFWVIQLFQFLDLTVNQSGSIAEELDFK